MKQALVLGLGKSGLAAALLLKQQGYEVIGIDQKLAEPPPFDWSLISLIVASPGVPPSDLMYQEALKREIEVIGEAELALRSFNQPAVAITGTNGKTTVTLLVAHILNQAGIKARALGNVGDPLATYVLHPDPSEVAVVELSSYQLETLSAQVFDAAVLLNVTPDHLDRYGEMLPYVQAKCRLQNCLKPKGIFYVQARAAEEWHECLLPEFHLFAVQRRSHEQENEEAAWLLCQSFGVTREQFQKGLDSFSKPPHRIEFIDEINGIKFFDDSKGTNLDAVIQAVKVMPGPVILIVGGVDKGASYLAWKEPFSNSVKRLIAFGEAAFKIESELSPYFIVDRVKTLDEALQKAQDSAKAGDCVLLSPGCSSFDQFRDYVHRGEEFQRIVGNLKKRE